MRQTFTRPNYCPAVEWPLIASSLIILRQYCRNQIESEQSSQKKFTENELVQLKPSKADKFKWGWSLTPGDKTPTPFEFPILNELREST